MSISPVIEPSINACSDESASRHFCQHCRREYAVPVAMNGCFADDCSGHDQAAPIARYKPDYDKLALFWQVASRPVDSSGFPDDLGLAGFDDLDNVERLDQIESVLASLQEDAELAAVRDRVRRSHSTRMESRWVW